MNRFNRRNEQGSVIILCFVFFVLLASMAASFLAISVVQSRDTGNAAERESALAVAEAGLDIAIYRMNTWTGGTALSTLTGTVASSTYSVNISPAFSGTSGTYRLTSQGLIGAHRRGIDVIVAPQTTAIFGRAVLSETNLTLDSNAMVDSYFSTSGSYASQVTGSGSNAHALSNGDLHSNANITTDSNTKIYGDASALGTVTRHGNSTISGTSTNGAATQTISPVTIPSSLSSLPAASAYYLGSNGSGTLTAGDYNFTLSGSGPNGRGGLRLDSNATLTIVGPARILITDLDLGSNSRITINATAGRVEFYVTETFDVDSNSSMASTTSDPSQVQVWATSNQNFTSTPRINFDSNIQFFGTVYAPNAKVRLDSNSQVFGAVVGYQVDIDSNAQVHYDENLATMGSAGAYRVRGWVEYVPAQ